MVKIAPSILSADFANLADEIKDVDRGGADYIHVDVMDGHFVPNITIGPLIVEAIKPVTNLPLDVHLMIESPEQYIEQFAKAGASFISVHQEACVHLHRIIQQIKSFDVKAGVAINPATPAAFIEDILPAVDLVVVMTVNPGFGGQAFIPEVVQKINQLNEWRKQRNLSFAIEIDGGVNVDTAKLCTDAGADILVAGSAVFNEKDRQQAITSIKKATK